jgi:hypothetical protein
MAKTSDDEIERQHKIALSVVRSSKPCAPRVDRGEIPLEWKQCPTVEDPLFTDTNKSAYEKDATMKCNYDEGSCISSRGMVDVQPLINLITQGCHDKQNPKHAKAKPSKLRTLPVRFKTNLWDEINACQNNVHITRPSHDAWGIKKIVLMFCDDFLQTVYEMPWWHSHQKMQEAVKPIFEVLNVEPNRIVRLLMAALPPGVTIPVHHDTGEWVRHTHRVHVPILVTDPAQILFRCGPSEALMERISCQPGHVFEMNNQGKHAVSNCHASKYRVHLILDYVDPSFKIKTRMKLNPGELLLQTRRSIDRVLDYGKRPTPSYLILGAQKSGTTSMYEYINQHPLAVRAKRRETHCLDWRWDDQLLTTEERRAHCHSFFAVKELKQHPSCMTGDSTPSYLLDSYRCIPRLKEVFNWDIQFIALLRDPVRRAKSHYEMVTSLDGSQAQIKARGKEWLELSLDEVIEIDLRNMKSEGLIPYWDMSTQTLDQSIFQNFVGSEEEEIAFQKYLKNHVPMNTGSHCIVSRGMYELQLRPWFKSFSRETFLVLKLEDMKGEGVQTMMEEVWKHLDLPPYNVEDESAKNTRSYDKLSDETKEMLQRFFAPHNERLEKLLGDGWKDPWKYEN